MSVSGIWCFGMLKEAADDGRAALETEQSSIYESAERGMNFFELLSKRGRPIGRPRICDCSAGAVSTIVIEPLRSPASLRTAGSSLPTVPLLFPTVEVRRGPLAFSR